MNEENTRLSLPTGNARERRAGDSLVNWMAILLDLLLAP
jgi:hypothetical protein